MPEKLSARVDRLEDLMATLAEAQIETEHRFQETDQRFRETDARIDKLAASLETERAESSARGRALDERIEKLVSAIGEMLRRNGKH